MVSMSRIMYSTKCLLFKRALYGALQNAPACDQDLNTVAFEQLKWVCLYDVNHRYEVQEENTQHYSKYSAMYAMHDSPGMRVNV